MESSNFSHFTFPICRLVNDIPMVGIQMSTTRYTSLHHGKFSEKSHYLLSQPTHQWFNPRYIGENDISLANLHLGTLRRAKIYIAEII